MTQSDWYEECEHEGRDEIAYMRQKLLEMAPEVVKARGLVYADVHNFRSKFVWSPDSRRIGVVDCMVDYRLRDDSRAAFEEGGKEENLRCFAIAAGLDGKFIKTRIPPGSNQEFGLKWIDVRTLRVEHDTKSFDLLMPYERSKSSK